ncbi:MAG: aminopeptidase P family protein [Chlorobiaceae bacterium]|jgi:Xaa-Pro dipeptidase|nr:aminopeptidase P family protein [Chlorobiaceae bacterium]
MLTETESQERILRLQGMLRSKDIHAALFIMPIDVYYFAGTRQNAILWIPAEGGPLLLVRKSLSRAREESPIADIRPFPSSKEFAAQFSEDQICIGMTFDVVPVQQQTFYNRALPGRSFVDISMMLRELRSVKSPFELEQLRLSAGKLSEVFVEVPNFLKAGMRELDVSAEMEYRLRKAGHEGYVRMRAFNQELFFGLAVSSGGLNGGFFDGPVTGKGLSCASPHGASCDEIGVNQPILLDYAGVFNGYIADMTRMFVIGTLDAELQRAFDVALDIQEMVRQAMKPGVICEELFLAAAAMADRAGLGSCFMGVPGEQAKFVGHGVGLELDELPVLAKGFTVPLLANQVIAVEPKFVIPGKGVIGIENTFVVTEDGGQRLSDLPDEIVFLEA